MIEEESESLKEAENLSVIIVEGDSAIERDTVRDVEIKQSECSLPLNATLNQDDLVNLEDPESGPDSPVSNVKDFEPRDFKLKDFKLNKSKLKDTKLDDGPVTNAVDELMKKLRAGEYPPSQRRQKWKPEWVHDKPMPLHDHWEEQYWDENIWECVNRKAIREKGEFVPEVSERFTASEDMNTAITMLSEYLNMDLFMANVDNVTFESPHMESMQIVNDRFVFLTKSYDLDLVYQSFCRAAQVLKEDERLQNFITAAKRMYSTLTKAITSSKQEGAETFMARAAMTARYVDEMRADMAALRATMHEYKEMGEFTNFKNKGAKRLANAAQEETYLEIRLMTNRWKRKLATLRSYQESLNKSKVLCFESYARHIKTPVDQTRKLLRVYNIFFTRHLRHCNLDKSSRELHIECGVPEFELEHLDFMIDPELLLRKKFEKVWDGFIEPAIEMLKSSEEELCNEVLNLAA